MSKKILPFFALALAALASGAYAQGGCDEKQCVLDVIIRDFPVGYYGFEMFDAEYRSNGLCTEKNDAREANWTPDNRICFSGDNYIPCSQGGQQLGYGKDPGGKNHKNANNEDWRGYCNGPDKTTSCTCVANGTTVSAGDCDWANPVGVSKGMVNNKLDYSKCKKDELEGEDGDPEY